MQGRIWNWEDDDLTNSINQWLMGILEPGLYRGFDFNATHSMVLNLIQTLSGFKKVKVDSTETNPMGIFITRQGVVITEDDTVTVNVAINTSGQPRIDTVYYTHNYSEVTGGTLATLAIRQGLPSATPVAPPLFFPNVQTKIGELYLPNGTTHLDDFGVIWTKSKQPFYGGHVDNFAYLDSVKSRKKQK